MTAGPIPARPALGRPTPAALRRAASGGLLALALAAPAAAEPPAPLAIGSDRLGNVFTTADPVLLTAALPEGTSASWRITDLAGTVVAQGRSTAATGRLAIAPALDRIGYFEAEIDALDPNGGTTSGRTSFARIEPVSTVDGTSPFGVMTHFAQGWSTDIVLLIAAAGIRHVRDEQYWAEMEPERGRFVMPAGYAGYVAALQSHGIGLLLEATFGNPRYDGGVTPFSPEAQAAFGRYAAELCRRNRVRLDAIEVWNEINGSFCDGPCLQDRPGVYAGMLKQAHAALKAVDPTVTVVGGAAVLAPLPWFRDLLDRGVLAELDVLAVHPYRPQPEGVEADIAALRALVRSYNGGRDKPIWATEAGTLAPTERDRHAAVSYLVRQLALLRHAGVERIYWYLARDYLDFEGMGLLRRPESSFGRYAPNPIYPAYAALIRLLGDATARERVAADPRTWLLGFTRKDGSPITVAWSMRGDTELELRAEQPIAIYDVMGNRQRLAAQGSTVALRLDTMPVYLAGRFDLVREVRDDRVVADSVADFALEQGRNGWYYGYATEAPAGQPLAFVELPTSESRFGTVWGGAGGPFLGLSAGSAHPSAVGDRPIWAVRRWISSLQGSATLAGKVSLAASDGDGTGVVLLADGKEVARWLVRPGSSFDWRLPVDLRQGASVDLAVTPGPGSDLKFDSTESTLSVLVGRSW